MHLLILVAMVLVTSSHSTTTIDPEDIDYVFGQPSNAQPREFIKLEDMKKPSIRSESLVDKDGQSCKCLPYFLCDVEGVGRDVRNKSVTGYKNLDVRFGENNPLICQESVEICCTIPHAERLVSVPKPDPTKVKGCGYRNPNGIGAIFNGANSQFGEFPWVIALLNAMNSSFVGVGVLIHPQVVMTAAHVIYRCGYMAFMPGPSQVPHIHHNVCATTYSTPHNQATTAVLDYALYTARDLKIRAGEWDKQTINEIFKHEERNVQEFYLHNEFNNNNLHNDIALLRLDRPLELVEHINVICLPEPEEIFDSHKGCIANGWGKTKWALEDSYAVILKKVEIDMIPRLVCNVLLTETRLGYFFKLDKSFVCAGGEEGKDTCEGDGGAPLACPMGNDRYKLTGLVSWGIECGKKDIPAVYTNVAMFRQWLDNKMADWGFQVNFNK